VQSELHENESQGCGGGFATCTYDEARFAEEEGVTVGTSGSVGDQVRGEVGTGVFNLSYLSVLRTKDGEGYAYCHALPHLLLRPVCPLLERARK
jgi:hypothetical protein